MNDIARCQRARDSLGIYALGAIDPAERAEADAHLATCPDCQEELAGLAGLAALLGEVSPGDAFRVAGPGSDPERLLPASHATGDPAAGDTLTPLLRAMARRRRVNRRRSLTAAAAALVIVAGSAIGVIQASGSRSGPVATHWETVAATNPDTHVSAYVKYAGTSSGTGLEVSVEGIPAGTTCEFWVLGPHGQRWQAGSWTVPRGSRSPWYQAISAAPVGAMRSFQITTGHTVLVTARA